MDTVAMAAPSANRASSSRRGMAYTTGEAGGMFLGLRRKKCCKSLRVNDQ